jgi:hypothetical protein
MRRLEKIIKRGKYPIDKCPIDPQREIANGNNGIVTIADDVVVIYAIIDRITDKVRNIAICSSKNEFSTV